MLERLIEEFMPLGIGGAEIGVALKAAYEEDRRFKDDIRSKGEEVLKMLKEKGKRRASFLQADLITLTPK